MLGDHFDFHEEDSLTEEIQNMKVKMKTKRGTSLKERNGKCETTLKSVVLLIYRYSIEIKLFFHFMNTCIYGALQQRTSTPVVNIAS